MFSIFPLFSFTFPPLFSCSFHLFVFIFAVSAFIGSVMLSSIPRDYSELVITTC